MSESRQELEAALSRAPEDWSVRLRLIEAHVREDDREGARRLVRESPDEAPLPPELQFRLHTLLTQGAAALPPLEGETGNEGGGEKAEETIVPKEETTSAPAPESSSMLPPDPAEQVKVRDRPPRRFRREKPAGWTPTVVPPKGASPTEEETKEPSDPGDPVPQPSIYRAMPRPAKQAVAKRWANYQGDLRLEPLSAIGRAPRIEGAAQKMSALSVALLVHLAVVILVGFIVIAVPRPKPPQLIATVAAVERDKPVVPVRLQKLEEQKPAAASAAAPNVIGAIGASPVKVPEMENTNAVDVTTMITGAADVGDGFSFAGDSREMSDVNFFGISAGGKRIVFIIDAGREMLVDEKGGMYAYDKVKSEIAAMMGGLNRGTKFNILLYEGKRLTAFAEEPVVAMPSNLRLAIEWLHPLNRTYENLGLAGQRGDQLEVEKDLEPVAARDLAHYAKAIQKALEWQAESIFCIASGYRGLVKTPTPEEMEKYRAEMAANPGTPGEVSAAERRSWNEAVQRTREWLQRENDARREKGLPPKVVLNFNELVREITGATPPRATGGTGGVQRPRNEPHTPDDIETLVKNGVDEYYRGMGLDPPSLHMVVFLGEDEDMADQTRDHFQALTRRNNGKFKMLRGLAALEDVTGQGN